MLHIGDVAIQHGEVEKVIWRDDVLHDLGAGCRFGSFRTWLDVTQAGSKERCGSFGAAPACPWPLHAPDLVLVEQQVA